MISLGSTKWVVLLIIVFCTLHLKLFEILNFQVSLGFLLIPCWFYLTYKTQKFQYDRKEIHLIFLIILLPFIPGNISSLGEFLKTYGQFLIAYFFVIRTINKPLKIDFGVIRKALYFFQLFLLAIVLLQFLFVQILGFTDFYNIFGANQLYYARQVNVYTRMKAFYLEPSYLAFVALSLFWTRHYSQVKISFLNRNLLLTILILSFAKSAAGFSGFFIILLFEFYSKAKRISWLFRILLPLTILLLIYYFSTDLYGLFRLDEVFHSDGEYTSGFMRIVLPIQVLYKMIVLDGHLFGLTFGQLDLYVFDYFNEFGEKSISNSFFLIIGYFGVLGMSFYFFLFFTLFKTNRIILKSFILLLLINLNNSGAFMTLQFTFVTFLIPFLAFKIYENKTINHNSRQKRQTRSNKYL